MRKDELDLGQCDPSDEECLAKYCSIGDVQCIESRDATLFEDYLDQLESNNQDDQIDDGFIITCDNPEIEFLNTENESCELLTIYFGRLDQLIDVNYHQSGSTRRSLDNTEF